MKRSPDERHKQTHGMIRFDTHGGLSQSDEDKMYINTYNEGAMFVYLCLLSGGFLIFLVRVFFFYSYFNVSFSVCICEMHMYDCQY